MPSVFDCTTENEDIINEALKNLEYVKKNNVPEVKDKSKKSLKPLIFEVKEENSNFTKLIKNIINSRDLTYTDLFDYCAKNPKKDGDDETRYKAAYNMMNTLKNTNKMRDDSLERWLDFLELDVVLVDKKKLNDINKK